MLQTLAHVKHDMNLAVLGKHHLDDSSLAIDFLTAAQKLRSPCRNGLPRIFHARRNDEMIQALILKHMFGAKIRILFTSTAQRHHSGFTRWLMSKMDAVISTCEAAASYLQSPPATLIPHGIDTELYRPADNRELAWQALGLTGSKGVGIFGRVRPQKGIDIFVDACLDAFELDQEYSAVIVGEITPEHQTFTNVLKARIRARGMQERFHFLGKQPFDRIPELIRAMSLVAALSRNEGYGLTVLEAMSSGVPVLASRAGAWPEIVRQGIDGEIVAVDDSGSATAALRKLISDPVRLSKMAVQVRPRILEKYRLETEAESLCQFYRQLQQTV